MKKIELFVTIVTLERNEIIKLLFWTNGTMTTNLVFRHMKVMAMSELEQAAITKTYYRLNILERDGDKRPIHILNRSSNQNSN